MESSNLEGFARAIENSLVRRILRSRVRSEEVPIDGSTFPLRKLITVAVLQLELDKKEASRHLTHLSLMEPRTRMHHQPVSIMPCMAHTTVAILMLFQISTLFRHGVQLRQLIAFSITSVTCIALLNQPQPRELWAFCLALGYTIWNLLPGSFALFHLPSHPTFMRNLRIRDQTGKCIVCWDTRPLAELHTRELQRLRAAHGRVRANGLPAVQNTAFRREGLAGSGGYEDCGCFDGGWNRSLSC
jgi:hypothetical protein